MAPVSDLPPLRKHQRLAMEALNEAWDSGRTRCWVELPPGAGKTRVGLEAIRARLEAGEVTRAVVFGPNTAIQGQWLRACRETGLEASGERELGATVTALTYQSLAVFDPDADPSADPSTDPRTDASADAEADSEAGADGSMQDTLLGRLHANGAGRQYSRGQY